MKLTLIGRPAGTKTEGQVVIFQLQGLPPATLPKELPTLPEHTPITWTVMLGLRQWSKVKESLARDKNDRLVLEGYPLIDGHKHILLVNSCFSVAMQRATKERQKAAAAS